MTNKERVAILKIANQLVMKCTEYTPPNVKYSKTNHLIAEASAGILNAVKHIQTAKP